ncbi:DUF1080 domain-containing protein [Cellulophaga sp. HaHa_2_95]|uniref:3-keto-disaccharide hydrolase n=1 Tax=Cellulophaga sp. HaHa_2_95 TaxID=2745558 RepID=UPI001C4FCF55|nr:DUF1080 domain-containing protein [Cellulophaga sp. HaHa_2_95]QXP54455.1 DUF1080 domain-containing protein [Cellulophaga sp. HaHa_2_95]
MLAIKNLLSVLLFILAFNACSTPVTPLFNGKDLSGWHTDIPAKDSILNAPNSFIVRDGILVSLGEPRGHLITDNTYKNYRLTVEYRFTKEAGNCGILVHASTPRALYAMFPKSMEVQMEHENAGDFWCIQMDITTNNMISRRGPKEEWGVVEGKARRIKNLTEGSEHALGEWNTMVIECFQDKIKVWVNGDFVNYGYNADETSGQIAIQAEGAEVAFKTLDLTPISRLSE